jgi:outer membrane protein OmpA-like peptidoglycan-associated protein
VTEVRDFALLSHSNPSLFPKEPPPDLTDMKTSSFTILFATVLAASAAAQTAAPLDAAAAKAALSQQAVKPRFVPKSPIKSRTYTRTAKGADVEIVEYADGQKEEHPYVAVPILFVRGKDELFDPVSATNVRKTAEILRDIMATDPKARFTIQGHSSAEGDFTLNQDLSDKRAKKIRSLLVEGQGLDGTRLAQVGFGPAHALAAATASEDERQKDRRVLIVRQ